MANLWGRVHFLHHHTYLAGWNSAQFILSERKILWAMAAVCSAIRALNEKSEEEILVLCVLFLHPEARSRILNCLHSQMFIIDHCSFPLFILFHSVQHSRQEYWSGLPFPSPVDHVLSQLSTMVSLSWVAQHSMLYSFIELHKAVIHVIIWLAFWDCGFRSGGCGIIGLASSVCLLNDDNERFMEPSWWEGLAVGKTGSYSGGQGHAQ